MIRVSYMTKTYYGVEIGDEISEEEAENISDLVSQGTPVIVVESLEDLKDFGIHEDVTMVD